MTTTQPEPIAPATDVRALFLGPKGENRDFFTNAVDSLVEEHIHWRRDFHPEDPDIVTAAQTREPDFEAVVDRSRDVLERLTSRLKSTSTPWFSTRYLGHMNSDTLMIANLAEIATILYNPNNVAYESSVATSQMETEVGREFAELMGWNADTAWGHITTDGTVANYEGLWLARNLKSLPAAIRVTAPQLVTGKSEWELMNLPTAEILDLIDTIKPDRALFTKTIEESSRGRGAGTGVLGKVLVPSSRHYSWDKAADLLGIGVDNLIRIPVDKSYRMDLAALQRTIDDLVAQHIPILALVGVVGTTEEGAVDDIAGMRDLIAANRDKGTNFYFHVDAAYGGYARTLFMDETNTFMSREALQTRISNEGLGDNGWPSEHVWSAFEAISSADSITIDPHKMGYVPYSAGGVTFRDRRILALISYAAAYVFEDGGNLEESLGSVVLEGSKSGTTAAGVWAAHQLLPLNHDGYGQLMARSWAGTHQFLETLKTVESFTVNGTTITCHPLLEDPDFNIICMAFNVAGNTSLATMNALNQELYHRFSYEFGPLFSDDWITSHTELTKAVYGDVPREFIQRMGIDPDDWDTVGNVVVLRSCVMHPWLAHTVDYPELFQSYLEIVSKTIGEILETQHITPPTPLVAAAS